MNSSAIHTTFNKRVNKSNHLSNLLNCNYLRGNEIFRSYFRMLCGGGSAVLGDSSGGGSGACAQRPAAASLHWTPRPTDS